ncbi:MAG TPA: UPF0182 family protein [Pyrinomonadaceae bacterium]|nr:UPF0182 family protein [Pyrinomonadaceae bacterium]
MSSNVPPDMDHEVIDIGTPPTRRRWRRWIIVAVVLLVLVLLRSLSIYIEALWFGSLGYASVYWYTFRLKIALFLIFLFLTLITLRAAFWLMERLFQTYALERRTILLNNQPLEIAPARILRPLAWAVSIIFALIYGLAMSEEWQAFALYFNQPQTGGSDPIFGKPLGFYLFTLPVHQLMNGWLLTITFIILCASLVFTLVSLPQQAKRRTSITPPSKTGYVVVSCVLAAFLLALAWRVYLSRFPYLWTDHQTFSGVTYTEDHHLLPGLTVVTVTLVVVALLAIVNAFTERRLRLLLAAIALPIIVYVVAAILVPSYVQSFVVKPNELGRETPYIEHNIEATRRAFGLDNIEQRDFEAEAAVASFNLEGNRSTLDNIRLWDWTALRDTLRQIQEIRTYYDFQDVDVDRYRVGGEVRQMMLAAREIDVEKLPEQSRNWINERLIYTHGYGVTMNTVNGFTPEGMPRFVLSNMPIESAAPEIKVTRPEIYFGQKTDTDVYVKTRQKEFNYPQGETNNLTTYEGTGGIPIGGGFRRLLIAWALDDLSKLPFSDDVTPESRVLMRRNIGSRVRALAPFLIYDDDPYIIVSDEGRLYWMIDAFTESASYPYSRHHRAGDESVNYIRNSVKVLIDAYNGSVEFYVFDNQDPIIAAYRATFPALFRDASQMPADLRAHVRYPQTLMETQGQVYGLYHTQNAKVFFQREDLWSVASQVSLKDGKREVEPLEPYFVLMQLPGEQTANEFVEILPFTPANRNNMIGWIAGRSDGAAYGSLIAYNFPKSRLIDGPLQIEARIDQNAQLSSQITLWSQQGSRVRRGNLLVIPIGRALLYVEPIYLQAERSPMPELRLVVVATQERLGYGPSFEEAMKSLFGDAAGATLAQTKPEEAKPESAKGTDAKPSETPAAPQGTTPPDTQRLLNQALSDLEEYQRLTAQGKLGEAGQKLESAKRALEEAKRQQKSP